MRMATATITVSISGGQNRQTHKKKPARLKREQLQQLQQRKCCKWIAGSPPKRGSDIWMYNVPTYIHTYLHTYVYVCTYI